MILCIDFTGKKVKITEVEKERKRFKVMASREMVISEAPTSLTEYLKNTPGHIEEIKVSGAMDNTFHKIFILPDMKKKILNSAVEAEVIKSFGNGYQFRYIDLGEVPGPGQKVNRKILSVGIKSDGLETLYQMFANSRIKPRIYTTYPVALQALFDHLKLLSEQPLAFIELDHPASRITIFKEQEIRLTRELPSAKGEEDPESSALMKDIYRTILFYNDIYPNERIGRLMFAGSSTISGIEQNLSQKTGAEIVPLELEGAFPGIEDPSSIYPGCLGLALLEPNRFGFGFVPLSVQERKKIKKALSLAISASLGVGLIIALVISRFSLDLRNLNVFHGGIKGEIKMKEDRLKVMPLEFVSQYIETSQPPWSEILLEIAAVVPQGVALKSLTLKNMKKMWRGEVTGVADGSDEINSLLKVEETQNNFVKSPLFKGVKLVEREIQGKRVAFKIIYQLDV